MWAYVYKIAYFVLFLKIIKKIFALYCWSAYIYFRLNDNKTKRTMYDSIKQIKEQKAKLNKEIKKLRKLEDADIENGTYDNDYYNAKWKYIQGKLDGLHIALQIVEFNRFQ